MAQCKHHEICGLTDEFDPKAGLCILHSHQPQKDQQAFADAFDAHRKAKGDRFSWMVFPGRVNFNGEPFTKAADFSGVTFTKAADFNGATFDERVYFIHATFSADAGFSNAIFTGRADFSNAIFTGRADFSQTTFTDDADFHEATFEQAANFGNTSFGAQEVRQFLPLVTTHVGATFAKTAHFSWATFTKAADFSEAAFLGEGLFRGTHFLGHTTFRGSHVSGKLLFTGLAGGQSDDAQKKRRDRQARREAQKEALRRGFKAVLGPEDAEAIFGPEPGRQQPSDPNSLVFNDADDVDFRDLVIGSPESLSFRQADFRTCRLLNTDLRKVELTGVQWPQKGARHVVYDEIKPILKKEDYPWEELERLYRELKQNYDERRNYARMGDFHYGEKEMQRRNPRTPFSLKVFLWLYWLVSGYGERFLRPLLWTVGLLVVATGAYLWWGLEPKPPGVTTVPETTGGGVITGPPGNPPPLAITNVDWLSAMHYSFRVITLLKPEDLVPRGFAKVIQTLQSLLGPLFLGLFALAVRQRLKH